MESMPGSDWAGSTPTNAPSANTYFSVIRWKGDVFGSNSFCNHRGGRRSHWTHENGIHQRETMGAFNNVSREWSMVRTRCWFIDRPNWWVVPFCWCDHI